MRFQTFPNDWSCLPTSIAVYMNVSVLKIFEFIGHDGSEIVSSILIEPSGRRNFHIQEMMEYCYDCHNIALLSFERHPTIQRTNEWFTRIGDRTELIKTLMMESEGIITGIHKGKRHAAIWFDNIIYNADGNILSMDDWNIEQFHVLKKLL